MTLLENKNGEKKRGGGVFMSQVLTADVSYYIIMAGINICHYKYVRLTPYIDTFIYINLAKFQRFSVILKLVSGYVSIQTWPS